MANTTTQADPIWYLLYVNMNDEDSYRWVAQAALAGKVIVTASRAPGPAESEYPNLSAALRAVAERIRVIDEQAPGSGTLVQDMRWGDPEGTDVRRGLLWRVQRAGVDVAFYINISDFE